MTVTVNVVNDPPVVDGIPDVEFNEDGSNSSIDLDTHVTDPDDPAADMTWTFSGNTSINVSIAADHVVTFTAPVEWSGSEDITFTATDTGGSSDSDTMTVIVNVVNDPPVVDGILDVEFDEDGSNSAIDLDTHVTDPDDPAADISWTFSGNTNINVSIDPSASHIVTFSPLANWNGAENITFTATDTGGLSDDDTMTVTVNPVNDPPTVIGLTIEPLAPGPDDDLHALYTYNDVDGDPAASIQVKWYKDDIHQPYDNVLTIPSSATSPNEKWYFEATPSDGIDPGETETSPPTLIGGLLQELRLYPGWNFISIYVDILNSDLLSALASIDGLYDSIWTYDAAAGIWRRYIPGGPASQNNLSTIEPGKGYWIRIAGAGEVILYVVGQEMTDTDIFLYAGRNMVGYNSISSQFREDALTSIADKLIAISTYDSVAGIWLKYTPGAPYLPTILEQLEPGKGYVIDVEADCTWSVSP